jgi:preprotein translocase subunit SecG
MSEKSNKEKLEDIISKIKEAESNKKEISKSKRFLNILTSAIFTLAILAFTGILLIYVINQKEMPEAYFSKKIKENIKTVIKAGGDISTVKHIFNTKIIKSRSLLYVFNKKEESFYPENTSLSQILNDLKVDFYLENSSSDSLYFNRIENITTTHNQVNPFDKLDNNQKFAFENIRTKLGVNYQTVQGDFNRIANELNNKNQLVGKYLYKSNRSYWISIIALAVTLILSTIQIFQNRNNKNPSKLLNEVLSEEKNDTEDNNEDVE